MDNSITIDDQPSMSMESQVLSDTPCPTNSIRFTHKYKEYSSTHQTESHNNNNNNCLKSNIQCIEIRVQWTVHLGSSHMHVHAVTRVHAVTPKLVICVMYLTSI